MNLKVPKILIVGEFRAAIHEPALYNAMLDLGYDVEAFKTQIFFDKCSDLSYRLQYHFQFGLSIIQLNKALKSTLKKNYDLIFLYRPRLIYKGTFKALNKSKIFIYNNDDPFSEKYHFLYWFNFKRLLPLADHIFSYRLKNINDYKSRNFYNTSLLRSWYIEKNNFYLSVKKSVDAIFIGHFEDDGRDIIFKFLVENEINLQIYGPGWQQSKFYKFFKTHDLIFPALNTEEYNEVLNSSNIAIVLFSKLNNDGYTRRCFEIPPTKTAMIAFKTNEISLLFNEEEIILFETKEELLLKIKYFLKNKDELKLIGENGFKRNLKDKNEVRDRAAQIMNTYFSLK